MGMDSVSLVEHYVSKQVRTIEELSPKQSARPPLFRLISLNLVFHFIKNLMTGPERNS